MNLQELKNILRAELPSQVIESTSVISEVDLLTGYLVGAVPKANLTVAAGQTKVLVQGSSGKDTIDLVAESVALGEAGDDLISTRDASGPNLVFGGAGGDHIIGGNTAALVFGGSRIAKDSDNIYSLTDTSMDINIFDVDSGDAQAGTAQFIGDFRVGVDKLRLGGKVLNLTAANYSQLVKNHGLRADGIEVGLNAAPVLSQTLTTLTLELIPGTPLLANLQDLGVDNDGDDLELVVLNGPSWISASGKKLVGKVPDSLKEQELATLNLHLGVTDGLVVVEFTPHLKLNQVNQSPTLTVISPLEGGIEDDYRIITYKQLTEAANESDSSGIVPSFRIEKISRGTTLQKWTGSSWELVTPRTLVSAGDSLRWKAAANANGLLNAFTVRAWDGSLVSSTPVQVKVRVAAVNDSPIGTVIIQGIPALGQTLKANTGLLKDADGLGTLRYEWHANGEAIAGANKKTYKLTDNEKGKSISVTVSYMDKQSSIESIASDPTTPVAVVGTAGKNTLSGGSLSDLVNGLGGQDILTGEGGPDVFGFRFGDSCISSPDRITDFFFGIDRIMLLSARKDPLAVPVVMSRAADNKAASLSALVDAVFADADGAQAGDQILGPNQVALVVSTGAGIAGSYLIVNDSSIGFQADSDLLINITGHSGTMPVLGVVNPSTVFV